MRFFGSDRPAVRGRWEEEELRLQSVHPDLRPATVHTLAAVHTLGVCARQLRIRHYFRQKHARVLRSVREQLVSARDKAWERVELYPSPDPHVRAILLEVAAIQELSCLQRGLPLSAQAQSRYDDIRGILERDAHHSPRSGSRSDGDLSRDPFPGSGGQDAPSAA